MQRALSLVDGAGNHFSRALPDVVLRGIEDVNRSASGNITISEQVTNPSTRDRYLINFADRGSDYLKSARRCYQLSVMRRSIEELHRYLSRKMEEVREFQQSIALIPGQFNHRQLALLENAVKNPDASYTSQSHSSSHNVTLETVRLDLIELERKGLLSKHRVLRTHVWTPIPDLAEKLRSI